MDQGCCIFFTLFILVVTFLSPHAFDIIAVPQTLQRVLPIVHWSHLHLFPISGDIIILSPWECNSFTNNLGILLQSPRSSFLFPSFHADHLSPWEGGEKHDDLKICPSTEQNGLIKTCFCSLSFFFAFNKARGEGHCCSGQRLRASPMRTFDTC